MTKKHTYYIAMVYWCTVYIPVSGYILKTNWLLRTSKITHRICLPQRPPQWHRLSMAVSDPERPSFWGMARWSAAKPTKPRRRPQTWGTVEFGWVVWCGLGMFGVQMERLRISHESHEIQQLVVAPTRQLTTRSRATRIFLGSVYSEFLQQQDVLVVELVMRIVASSHKEKTRVMSLFFISKRGQFRKSCQNVVQLCISKFCRTGISTWGMVCWKQSQVSCLHIFTQKSWADTENDPHTHVGNCRNMTNKNDG